MDNRAKRLVHICLDAGLPVVVTGPPGVGKTGHFMSLDGTRIQGREVVVVPFMLSVRESAEIGGFPAPHLEDGVVDLLPVRAFARANQLAEEGKLVVCFLDEIRTITESQQAAAMKFVHEGIAGDIRVSPYVRRAAAANSVEDSANGIPMAAPMANRWMHVYTKPNASEWCDDMRMNKYALQAPLSEKAQEYLPQERALVATYISRKPSQLFLMPKTEEEVDGPWASPRTNDYVAHAWAAAKAMGEDDMDTREMLMAMAIGEKQAGVFVQWRTAFDLPDPEEVLDGTYKGKLVDPDRPDRTYTIMSAICSAVADKWEPVRYEQAWKVHADVANEGAGDVAAATVGTLMKIAKTHNDVPSIAKHAVGFTDFLRRAGWNPPV